ncbi:ATP-binding protein [Murimonas intestini]|uniref:ATP-binding protein n=1 Tax=Murimonas intestini TaxID=1337051 RepID=UPI0011DD1BD5|nr:ATP-binding protein [Murimonas intestini]
MENIIIGKYALESLTTGMYSDSLVVFREYIQNSADAIDDACKKGVLKKIESKIEVQLFPIEGNVIIKDNGTGISYQYAEKTLISIGNSKKVLGSARGFRGIGRLAALGYCGKLIFETSYTGEEIGTRLIIDAKELSKRLTLEENFDISAEEVLKEVYFIEQFQEQKYTHYFNVIMKDVSPDSELINYEAVYEYLIQTAPVAYDAEKFTWGKEIKRRFKNEGYNIPDYNIYLSYAGNTVPIYKAYSDEFFIDKRGNIVDRIKDIQIIKLIDLKGNTSAYGWIPTLNYMGSIYDKSFKGLRIRKGNILVGDGQTLNICFKDPRFNGWTLGEIFVIDDKHLIPNARRDNFEKNSTYFIFIEQIRNIAASIIKEIRSVSVARNTEQLEIFDKQKELESNVEVTRNLRDTGLGEKTILRKRLINVRNALNQFSSIEDTDLYNKEIAFDEIDMLIGKLQGTTAYKSINSMQNLSKIEKRTLEKVFDTIVSVKSDDAEVLIDSILKVFVC